MDPSCCCCKYETVGHFGMQTSPHINKTHLPNTWVNVRELKLNYSQKTSQGKKGRHWVEGGRWKAYSPSKAFRFIKQNSLFS